MKLLENIIYQEDIKRVLSSVDLTPLRGKCILVTGGLGLVCSAVVDILHSASMGIRIIVAARKKEKFESRYGGYYDIEFVKYDALNDLNLDFKVDYIIHGAGLSSPELYVNMPVETMLSNINGIVSLLEYSYQYNVKRLLYVSSCEVYGHKTTTAPFIEDCFGITNINTVRASYPESKRASEVLCKSFSSEYNIDTVIVRPGHIFGPTSSINDMRISSEFAFKAARHENLYMKSNGIQNRSYCYCLDCAKAILIVLLKGTKGESYNIGHDEVTSIRKMCEIIAEVGCVELFVEEPKESDLKQFNPMNNATVNNDKIKMLGYRDTFSIEEGLKHTVEILRELCEQ